MRSNFAVLWKFKAYLDKRWVGGSKMFLFMLRVKKMSMLSYVGGRKDQNVVHLVVECPLYGTVFLIIYLTYVEINLNSTRIKEKPFLNLEFVYIFQIDSVHIRSVRW